MKKFLSVLFCLVLALALVGCKKSNDNTDGDGQGGNSNDPKTETKITIDFNSNGGSQIASKEVTVDESGKVNFTLPEDPLKPGFVFNGWYFDEALTQEFDLAKLATLTKVTLYASWTEEQKPTLELNYMPGLDLDPTEGINLEFNLAASAKVDEEKVFDANINVKVQSEKAVVEALEEFDVEITLLPTFTFYAEGKAMTQEELLESEDSTLSTIAMISGNEFKLLVQDGVLYGVIPGAFLGSEGSNMVLKVVLQDVVDALKEKLDELMEYLPEEAKEFLPEENPEVSELTPEEIENLISEAVAKAMAELNKLGISNDFVAEFIALAAEFLPTQSVDGNVTTYEFTQEGFEKGLDDAAAFFENHFDEIATAVVNAGIAEAPSPDDKADAIKDVKEAVEEVKQAINIEALKASIQVDDNDLPTDITGQIKAQFGPEANLAVDGNFYLKLDDESLNFIETLSLIEEEFEFAENCIISIEKVSENKGVLECRVGVTVTSKVYDEEKEEYVDEVTTVFYETKFSTEKKDNSLEFAYDVAFEIEDLTSASVNITATLTDNGAYQKVAFAGGELATDMTEFLVSYINEFDVASLFGGASDSEIEVE